MQPRSSFVCSPEMQIYFVSLISLANQKNFTLDLYQIIKFLISLPQQDICDLSNKFMMQIGYIRFFKNCLNNKKQLLKEKYIFDSKKGDKSVTEFKVCEFIMNRYSETNSLKNIDSNNSHGLINNTNSNKAYPCQNYFSNSDSKKNQSNPQKIYTEPNSYHFYNSLIIEECVKNDKELDFSGANALLMAFGYAKGGHENEAYSILKKFTIYKRRHSRATYIKQQVINSIACGFIAGGFPNKIDSFIAKIITKEIDLPDFIDPSQHNETKISINMGMARGYGLAMQQENAMVFLNKQIEEHKNNKDPSILYKIIGEMAIGFAISKCRQESYKILEKINGKYSSRYIIQTLENIAEIEYNIGTCLEKEVIFKMLIYCYQDYRKYPSIYEKLQKFVNINIEEAWENVEKLSLEMRRKNMTYNQLRLLSHPNIKVMITKKEVTEDFTHTVTDVEVKDLLNKLTFATYKECFFAHFKKQKKFLINEFAKPIEEKIPAKKLN